MSWRDQVQRLVQAAQEDDDEAETVALSSANAAMRAAMDEQQEKKRGGSQTGKRANIERNRHAADQQLHKDCSAPNPIYSDAVFRHRFRMSRRLFNRLVDGATSADSYFTQRADATGLLRFAPRQKITAALQMLCYGVCADATDEYIRIAESTAMKSLERFTTAVIDCFGGEYLREPTAADMQKHADINAMRGFPGMFEWPVSRPQRQRVAHHGSCR